MILSNAVWHYYYATDGPASTTYHRERLASEAPLYRFQRCVELAAQIRKSGFGDTPEDILKAVKQGAMRSWNGRDAFTGSDSSPVGSE